MVVGVDRAQLQGMLDSIQLLQAARIDVPVYAYLFARFRKDAHEQIRRFYLDRLQDHFEGMTGVDDVEAARRAAHTPIDAIGVRIRLTPEILVQILGAGYPVQQALGVIALEKYGNVRVKIHPGVGAVMSYNTMTDLTLVHRQESLEAYLFRLILNEGGGPFGRRGETEAII